MGKTLIPLMLFLLSLSVKAESEAKQICRVMELKARDCQLFLSNPKHVTNIRKVNRFANYLNHHVKIGHSLNSNSNYVAELLYNYGYPATHLLHDGQHQKPTLIFIKNPTSSKREVCKTLDSKETWCLSSAYVRPAHIQSHLRSIMYNATDFNIVHNSNFLNLAEKMFSDANFIKDFTNVLNEFRTSRIYKASISPVVINEFEMELRVRIEFMYKYYEGEKDSYGYVVEYSYSDQKGLVREMPQML